MSELERLSKPTLIEQEIDPPKWDELLRVDPYTMLKETYLKKPVVIKLKWGTEYFGLMAHVDRFYNVVIEHAEDLTTPMMGIIRYLYIRGNNILHVRCPDSFLEKNLTDEEFLAADLARVKLRENETHSPFTEDTEQQEQEQEQIGTQSEDISVMEVQTLERSLDSIEEITIGVQSAEEVEKELEIPEQLKSPKKLHPPRRVQPPRQASPKKSRSPEKIPASQREQIPEETRSRSPKKLLGPPKQQSPKKSPVKSPGKQQTRSPDKTRKQSPKQMQSFHDVETSSTDSSSSTKRKRQSGDPQELQEPSTSKEQPGKGASKSPGEKGGKKQGQGTPPSTPGKKKQSQGKKK